MNKLNSETALQNAIQQLEAKQRHEADALTEQFHTAYESLKPINLIKSTIKDAAASIDLKNNLLNTTIALASGYLSKKLYERFSKSPLKRLVGSALMFGVTNLIAKNPETIKSVGEQLLNAVQTPATQHDNDAVPHQAGVRITYPS